MTDIYKKIRRATRRLQLPAPLFRLSTFYKQAYYCPICAYDGPFRDETGRWISKRDTKCPGCGSTERTRMLWVVLEDEMAKLDCAAARALHFAPEAILMPLIRKRFGSYETSDFEGHGADHCADLRCLPFEDASYDVLIASHVLEHIKEDREAIMEIRRVLRPGGLAILPVPLSSEVTVEYDQPRPEESGHVRAPGIDYFDRYREFFTRVDLRSAGEFPTEYHLIPDLVGMKSFGLHYIPVCHV